MTRILQLRRLLSFSAVLWLLIVTATTVSAQKTIAKDRMNWWREARFGLFIHWGLYAVPAGEWNGQTGYGEWIRSNAQIPLDTYNQFVPQFNPTKFNALEWVKMAKDAGMKYITITTKHHDGFAMFDSKQTDFDIMSTPFHRDILKELAAACKQEDITLCFYHSIMDWHHPDYLPRREWEKDRATDSANFDRYVTYMKAQLKELLTNYGKIGVVWFDGEWENTWTHEKGKDLYQYVRSLQPSVIVNNRVDKGRNGMVGMTKSDEFKGDFGTPEQEIPATGFAAGVDWESCMTMNDNWGYNSHDTHWKSPEDLVHKLVDIASKGGNFLLNVGPTSEGLFPSPAIERLKDIGAWMKINSSAVYGTTASPFKNLTWGRCTQKAIPGGTKLYLHVFDWPADGKLLVPGLGNAVTACYPLAAKTALKTTRKGADYSIDVNGVQKQDYATVIVLEIKGKPVIYLEPVIKSAATIFTDQLPITVTTTIPGAVIRYTTDGKIPTAVSPKVAGPIVLKKTVTVQAVCFVNGTPVSPAASAVFEKVTPKPAQAANPEEHGLDYAVYEGKWSKLPDFPALKPVVTGITSNFDISIKAGTDEYGFVFNAWINIPADGVYTFYISSDDGSKLLIDDSLLVDNDGLHNMLEKSMDIPLAKGYHAINVLFFEGTGSDNLELHWKGPGFEKSWIPSDALYRRGPVKN